MKAIGGGAGEQGGFQKVWERPPAAMVLGLGPDSVEGVASAT
jgi:hypothetical protein